MRPAPTAPGAPRVRETPPAGRTAPPEARTMARSPAIAIGAAAATVIVIVLAVLLLPKIDFGGAGNAPGPGSTTSNQPAAGSATCAWANDDSPGHSTLGKPPTTVPGTGRATLTLTTNRGTITVDLDRAKTPCAVASLSFLTGKNYYRNTSCHRLDTAISVLQCGDPTGTGAGTPGYLFADENLPTGATPAYRAGDVAMANAGSPWTDGSQFFFVYEDSDLPPGYGIFGHVVTGLDVVKAVAAGGDDGALPGAGGHPTLPLTFTTATVS